MRLSTIPFTAAALMLFTIKQAILEFGKCATGTFGLASFTTNSQAESSVAELIQLEDRVLYSASPIEVQEPAIQIDIDVGFDAFLDSATVLDNDIVSLLSYPGDSSYIPLSSLAQTTELIIVDPNVDGYQELVEGIVSSGDRNFELAFLQSDADGVEQITQLLSQYSNLDAIHLVSHGNEGAVQLGNTQLSMDSLAGYASDITRWNSALSSHADLLIYGCDLASNEDGETLIEAISALTEADVAASNDLTGHTSLGADWTLEFATGQIEADIVFGQQIQQAWYSVLAVTASTDTYSTGENTILSEAAASGVLDNDIEGVGPVATVTPGAILNYDASLDVTSNGWWEDTNGNSTFDWVLDPAVTLDSSPTNAPPGITAAYNFDGSSLGLISTPFESMTGDEPTDESATFEIWFRTDSPSDRRGVLFDTGTGNDGTNLRLYQDSGDSYIEFLIIQGAAERIVVTANITTEISTGDFIQVAGSFNVATGTAELYVNGVLVGSDTNVLVTDWSSNADGSGIGDNDLGFAYQNDPHLEGLQGQIGIFRIYDSALTAPQVQQNYDAITTSGGGGLTVTSFDATSVAGATVNVNPDGSFTYDPGTVFDYLRDGQSVIDTFTYTAEDGSSNTDTETVSITINGVTEAPTDITLSNLSLNEHIDSTSGYSVGTLTTTDEDNGETFTYSVIGGADASNFSIGGGSFDELILTTSKKLDFETKGSYDVIVQVEDSGGFTYNETITIGINDLIEPVANAGGTYVIYEGESLDLDGSGSTDDGTIVQYLWDLNNDLSFGDVSTDSTSVGWSDLVTSWGINDGDVGGRDYTIGLQVVDNQGGTNETTVTVTVYDVAPELTTTGTGSVVAGSLYTLTLGSSDFGDDLISDWIIDWGDGTVDSPGGNPATWSHTYLEAGNYDITAAAIDEDGTHLQNDLLVTGFLSSQTYTFDANTGSLLDSFDRPGQEIQIDVGPDGNLFVTGLGSTVREFLADGTSLGDFITGGGLTGAEGVVFGPDGNLYVTSFLSNEVQRFDGTTGAYIDNFAVGGALDGPTNLTFGPDGNLYVSSWNTGEVLQFDGHTGVFMKVFASGLSTPEALLFSPDGNLYVASRGDDEVVVLDGNSGLVLDTLTDANLNNPWGLAFGPDGMLYVSGFLSENIVYFDVASGSYMGELITSAPSGLSGPTALHFMPGDQVTVSAATGVSDAFWLSTQDDVTASGTDGIADWTDGTVLQIGDPNFALENLGTTSGIFSSVLNLDGFADGDVEIQGMHYVTTDIWIGGDNSVQLFAGDILLSVNDVESFNGTGPNSLTVQNNDIFIFRPDVVGDYADGTFEILMDNLAGAKLHAFTLVEQDTLIGDTIVRAGDFLYATSGIAVHDQIMWFQTTGAGNGGATSGLTPILLIDGDDLGYGGDQVQGLDLVESPMVVGDHSLITGQLLITLNNSASAFGTSVTEFDVFYATLSATTYGSGTSAGTANVLLEGLDVNLEAPAFQEDIHALTLVAAAIDTAPTDISPDTFSLVEGTDTTAGVNLATLTATDPDGGSFTYSIAGGADLGNFSLVGAGDELTFTAGVLDHETQDVYSVDIRVTDSVGNTYEETINVNVDDVNEAPTVDDQSFSIDEGLSNGNVVGTIAAADLDVGVNGGFNFSVTGGTGATAFAVDTDGQITVADVAQLDFETTPSFTLDIQVTDDGAPALSDTATITIDLNDVQNFLVVNTTNDDVDGDVDSIGELLADMGTDGVISLREAILATNNTLNDGATPDEIRFAIAGSGVQTIAMGGGRMEITDAVYLNATTQSGYTYDTPMIEIDGSGMTFGERDIFWITGGGTTVRGFVLNNAGDDAIDIEFGDGNTIVGNFIGTDATGTSAAANDWGIAIKSNNNVIGGTTDADRNIISGNNDDGIIIHESNDNGDYFPATGNQILGNLIGVDLNGDALGNGGHGVLLEEDAAGTQIGGILDDEGNVIANNGFDGVSLDGAGSQNSILGNIIFDNGSRGIDIGNDGVTPNNTPGPGPNDYQNYPDLTAATTNGTSLITIDGSLTGDISADYRIEFFANNTADGTGHGEAEIYLGFADVSTDLAGVVNFSEGFAVAVPVGYEITATATDAAGNTSEFAMNVVASNANLPPTGIGPNSLSIDENTDTSSGYSLGVLTATDPDAIETFTFEVQTGLDSGKFAIGGAGLNELILNDGILDHELQDTYYVIVRVTDSVGNQYDELITVSVDDLNEAPTAITPTSFNVDENTDTASGYSVGVLGATDEDDGETFTYSIEGGADELVFSIGGAGLNELVLTDGTLDHENQDSYSVVVRVADGLGLQYDETITVLVDDLNEAPTAITPTSLNLNENTDTTGGFSLGLMAATDEDDGDSFTYRIAGGADMSHFSVAGGNELMFDDGVANFEAQSGYSVDVEVEDSAGNTFVQTITVGIDDQNDDPEIVTSTMSIVESQNNVGMVAATDEDVPSDTLTFSIAGSGADDSQFVIATATGQLSFVVAPNFETPSDSGTDNIYNVDILVDDGEGGSSVSTVTVSVLDDNETPTAGMVPILLVDEDAGNQVVNLRLIFEDPEDIDSALTYTIENVSNSSLFDSFNITPTDRLILDFAPDQNGSALITIRATDSGGLFVDTVVRVVIRPVNDDPFVSAPIGPVVVNEDATDTFIDFSTVFDDVDIVTNGDVLTYAVSSNSNPTLVDADINGGILQFDYQDDQFGVSTIVVVATDAAGSSVSETISLTVNPVQDPTIVIDDRFPASGVDPITISSASLLANDSDDDSTNLTVEPVAGSEIGGVLRIDGAGNLVFTPNVLAAGIVSFQYVVFADGVTSLPGTVSINLAAGTGILGEDPPAEEPEDEPGTTDPPIDRDGGTLETGPDDPIVSGADASSDSADNLADTVSNDASSFEIQDDELEFRSAGLATTYAYADNQQLGDLIFQFATTKLNEKLVLSTFDPTFIANVFWDELDNANREFLVNNLHIGIPKIVASTASFLTVGYLAWIIRGGVLMTTVMTSLPAWKSLDIVPIIESANLAEEDDESIEQMVDN